MNHLVNDFVTLYAIFNPTGIIPSYIYYTRDEPASARFGIALRCTIIAASILLTFIVVGQVVLDALNVSIASFGIAGGLLLLAISFRMIFQKEERTEDLEEAASVVYGNIAAFPLATPLIAGPGGILVVVLLTDNNRFDLSQQMQTAAALVAVMVLTFFALLLSGGIQRLLGTSGIAVVSRVTGLILAAVAVQTLVGNVHMALL